jgi:hypothetical protein
MITNRVSRMEDNRALHEKAFDGWIPLSVAYCYLLFVGLVLSQSQLVSCFGLYYFPLVT